MYTSTGIYIPRLQVIFLACLVKCVHVSVCVFFLPSLYEMLKKNAVLLLQAMEAVTRNGPSIDVLHAIIPAMDDRNAQVSAKVKIYSPSPSPFSSAFAHLTLTFQCYVAD